MSEAPVERGPAPHFIVDELAEPSITLSPGDSRHALKSLRLRPGDDVTLADGRGTTALGRITSDSGGAATIGVTALRRLDRPSPRVCVALAPPASDRLAWGVQKLAELGVDEVVLIETERSVRRWKDDRIVKAVARLRSIAREAAMQSRQAFVMDVRGGPRFQHALGAEGSAVVLWERAERPLRDVLPDAPAALLLAIGPEGGLSDAEVNSAASLDIPLASLGPNILRTETAAVVGATLVLARYGRLG